MKYVAAGVPLVVIAGKEYGTGSSRDWAAKGTSLLGVKAVIAESFERIHRANLVGMGVFPLTFQAGQTAASLGLDGTEAYDFEGLTNGSREARVNGHQPVRQGHALRRERPRRHAEGMGVHGERRDPALRAAPARGLSRAAMRVAVFDLDGTITRADTLWPYLRGWVRRQRRPGFWRRALAAAGRYPVRPRPRPAQVRVDPRRHGWRHAQRSGRVDGDVRGGPRRRRSLPGRAGGDRAASRGRRSTGAPVGERRPLRPGHRPATRLRRDDLHRGRLARRAARRRAGDGKSPRRGETALHRGAPRPPPGRALRRLRQCPFGFRSPRDRGRTGSRQCRPVTRREAERRGFRTEEWRYG